MTTRPAALADDHTVVVPEDIQAVILNAARGSKQRAICEELAYGKPIRIDDYLGKKWAASTFRSFMSVVERLRQQGVVIAEGAFGPRGGKRWRFHPDATMAITATDPDHIKDFATSPDPHVRAAVASNPNIPEATQALLAADSDRYVLCRLIANPNVTGPALEALAKENDLVFESVVFPELINNPATPTSALEYLAAHSPTLSRQRGAAEVWVERQDEKTKAIAHQLFGDDKLITKYGIGGLIPLIKELAEEPPTQSEPSVDDEDRYTELGDSAKEARADARRRKAEKLTRAPVDSDAKRDLAGVVGSLERTVDENQNVRDGDIAAQVRERRLEALYTIAEELKNSDAYLAALRYKRQIPRYSLNNTFLLLAQCEQRGLDPYTLFMGAKGVPKMRNGEPVRDAAGFREVIKPGWNAYGRHIKKGEKALWILRPNTYKTTRELDQLTPHEKAKALAEGRVRVDEETGKQYAEVTVAKSFSPTPVFAYEQTDGEDLPPTLLPRYIGRDPATEEDIREWRKAIEAEIRNRGFDVEYGDSGRADGYTSYREMKVVIDDDLAPADQLNTLAHELGHIVCGHGDEGGKNIHRGTKEIEAESVAFLLCDEAGLDTSEFSMEYIVGWDEVAPDDLGRTGDKVLKIVNDLTAEGPIAALIAKREQEAEMERTAQPKVTPTTPVPTP